MLSDETFARQRYIQELDRGSSTVLAEADGALSHGRTSLVED
jgi:hypothetical protein